MTEGFREQRRYPRVPTETPVLVRLAKAPEIGTFSETRDLGLGGCLFSHYAHIPPDTAVWVAIALRDRVLEIPSRTVYVNERQDGRFDIGVEFLLVGPKDRILLAEALGEAGTPPERR